MNLHSFLCISRLVRNPPIYTAGETGLGQQTIQVCLLIADIECTGW